MKLGNPSSRPYSRSEVGHPIRLPKWNVSCMSGSPMRIMMLVHRSPFDSANDSAEARGRVRAGAVECGRVRATA